MNTTSTKWRRPTIALTVVIAAGLAVGACGSGDSGSKSNKNNSSGGVKGAAALVAKGLQEQAAGDLASAKRDYTQAIVDDPKNKYAYYNLGLIQQLLNEATTRIEPLLLLTQTRSVLVAAPAASKCTAAIGPSTRSAALPAIKMRVVRNIRALR